MSSIRIVSDGKPMNTHIFHEETGQDLVKLMPITKIEWSLDANDRRGRAVIHVEDVGISIKSDVPVGTANSLLHLLQKTHNDMEWVRLGLQRVN